MFQIETSVLCFKQYLPIYVYMKNLFFRVLTASIFISCTRAVDTENSKVVIQLPELSSASLKNNIVNSKVSILSDGISSEETSTEEFSNVEPTAFSGATPINCYLVGIGGPENFLNVNFAGPIVNGVLQATYKFGPFIGLRKAGESIEFMVAPGDNRVVYIFGVLASDINDCKDLQTEKPSKASFSKPYMLGQSSPMKFIAGQDVVVPVSLNQPVATNKMDDFFIATFGDRISLPPATMAVVENNSFPQNTFRKKSIACEPLDISLRAGVNSGPGILPYPVQASVISQDLSHVVSTAPLLYESFSKCVSNDSTTSVEIPAGQNFKRVWTRIGLSDSQSSDLSVAVSGLPPGGSLSSPQRLFSAHYETELKFEIIAPRSALKNVCLPMKVNIRKINGVYFSSSNVILNLTAQIYGAAPVPALFFTTHSDCTAGTNPTTSFSMYSGTTSIDVFMKVIDDSASSFGLQANSTGGTVISNSTGVQINKEQALVPYIAEMRFDFKNHFTTGLCVPLNMQFFDQKGNYVFPNAVQASRILSIDAVDSNMAGVSVHMNDPTCSASGVTSEPAFTSGAYNQFYVLVANGQMGLRSISFKLDTGVRRKIFFDVINPTY